MIEIDLPEGVTNPRIVLSYHGEIRLMVSLTPELIKNWTPEQSAIIRQKKIEYLEKAIGYKIVPMDEIIKHDDYEKIWHDYIVEQKEKEKKN